MTNAGRHPLHRPWDSTTWYMVGPAPKAHHRVDWYLITDGRIDVHLPRAELERSYTARTGIVGRYALPENAKRSYIIDLRILDEQADRDVWCEFTVCSDRELGVANCTVYGVDMDGRPLETQCCEACIVHVIDQENDTDPSQPVVVERKTS